MISNERDISASTYWLEAWEYANTKSERSQSDAVEEKFWQEQAPTYDDTNPLAPYAEEIIKYMLQFINKEDTVLEIGPGTGGFTHYFADKAGNLTVVEPSESMYEVFAKKWKEQLQLPLPKVLHQKWEDVTTEKADVIFGVNAFYRMKDMKSCLLKMNELAKKEVFLVQSVGEPFAGPLRLEKEGEMIEVERAQALANILEELAISHNYKVFSVQRKCGSTHDVACIHWKTSK